MAPRGPLIASCVGENIRSDDDSAIVPWWSITKTALAACALLLVAGGRLELDRAFAGRKYTLRQLLQHTSGLRCYTASPEYEAEVARHDDPWGADRHVLFADRPALFEPDTNWKYSNSGYFLVARAIEQATGMAVEPALQAMVLGPLGIEKTFIARTRADLARSVWGDEDNYHPGWVAHGLLMGDRKSTRLNSS